MRDGLSSDEEAGKNSEEKQNEDSDTGSEVWSGNRENKESQGRKNARGEDGGKKESQGKKKTLGEDRDKESQGRKNARSEDRGKKRAWVQDRGNTDLESGSDEDTTEDCLLYHPV